MQLLHLGQPDLPKRMREDSQLLCKAKQDTKVYAQPG